MPNPAVIKAAAALLSDERTRKGIGWIVVAILSPVIVLIALICSLGSGTSSHNASVVELCFSGGILPPDAPAEYVTYIEDIRSSFALLDSCITTINENAEEEKSLDGTRVKAIFFALYFGADSPGDAQSFADCFVTYEDRTRTVAVTNADGTTDEQEETYTAAIPIEDLNTVYQNIGAAMGITITDDQKANAGSIYNLVRYGAAGGGGIGSTDVPFIGADGFCSPVGENWRNIVTSEFGYRRDPFTGQSKGHGGIDLGVPTGTSVRAALPGTVTVSQYSSSYGYYVMIDHGGGLSTLYAHNSKLLVSVGQTVSAGDIVSLSGSTGRSTGPHVHFEVRVNGERTDPRSYLP